MNINAQTAQASPVQLVLILMDGLLAEVARVRAHIAAKRYEQKAKSLDKCIDMLNGLASALDTDSESEVVRNLDGLYQYCSERLFKAGISMDTTIVDEVTALLATIRNGWQGVQDRHG